MFEIGDKILAYIGGTVSVALAIALLVMWLVDHARIDDLTKDRDGYKTALHTEQGNSAKLGAGIDLCNAGVASLKKEGDAVTAAANAALATAKASGDMLRKAASQVLAAKPGADLCKSSDQLIMGHVQ